MTRTRIITLLVIGTALLGIVPAWLSCSSQDKAPPNIVLIVVDALRPDFLGCYGYDRPTSPNIDALARRGALFETAVAHAPWTKTSFASFLTSLYPFQHGVVDWESVMPDTVTTLPEVLGQGGYSTLAVINMLGITGEFKVTGGFDQVSEAAKRNRDAFATTQDAVELIKNSRKPFFILIHYFDTHWPYRPAPQYVDLVRREGEPDPFTSRSAGQGRGARMPAKGVVDGEKLLYSACIRFVDDAVGRLLGFLDGAGLKQKSVIIVTSDHGEAFWEHGVGSHGGNLYDEAIKVPLVVSYPAKYRDARRVPTQVRHIDIAPTIMDFAGVVDKGHREGTSLRRLIEGGDLGAARQTVVPQDVALCESSLRKSPDTKCVRTDRFKLIIEPATGLAEFYDLLEDPLERSNVRSGMPAEADSLGRILSRIPGSTVEGWRVALTGEGGSSGGRQAGPWGKGDSPGGSSESLAVKITARVGGGGHISYVHRVSTPGDVAIVVAPDSVSLTMEAVPKGLQIVLFGVEPQDAEVSFNTAVRGEHGPVSVHAGAKSEIPVGQSLTLDPARALGLPSAFEEARRSLVPSVHVWYLRGEAVRETGKGATLSPDTRERLRSLGYIQ